MPKDSQRCTVCGNNYQPPADRLHVFHHWSWSTVSKVSAIMQCRSCAQKDFEARLSAFNDFVKITDWSDKYVAGVNVNWLKILQAMDEFGGQGCSFDGQIGRLLEELGVLSYGYRENHWIYVYGPGLIGSVFHHQSFTEKRYAEDYVSALAKLDPGGTYFCARLADITRPPEISETKALS